MNFKETWEDTKNKFSTMGTYFSKQKDMILTYNLHIYAILSVFCVITVVLYTLTTGVLLREWRITPFHIILLVLLIIHIFVAFYVNSHRLKRKTVEKALCVAFSLCVFLMLVCLDTVASPDKSQTFCCAYLVVAPCLFIMNFSRMIIDQVFFVVVYGAFAFIFKQTNVAFHDMYAIWTGFFFGIILYAVMMDLRLQVNMEVVQLKHFSETDELTKINNRRECNVQISYLLEKRKTDAPCALIMMDVDFFKTINDTYGHTMGDKVLVEVANVLSSSFRQSDVVSRFGGDEFMVFISEFNNEAFLPKKCADVQSKVSNIMKDTLKVSCSIGVCMVLSGRPTMEEMVSVADKALYETKERQRGGYTISRLD